MTLSNQNISELLEQQEKVNQELGAEYARIFFIDPSLLTEEMLKKIEQLTSEVQDSMNNALRGIPQKQESEKLPPTKHLGKKKSLLKKIKKPVVIESKFHELEKKILHQVIEAVGWKYHSPEEEGIVFRAARLLSQRVRFAINYKDGFVSPSRPAGSISLLDKDYKEDVKIHNIRVKPVKFRR